MVTMDLDMPLQDAYFEATDLQLHPELLQYDKLYESVAQSELLNQKESAPMWGVGMNYTIMGMQKDMVMPMVSLSIPIFNNSFKSKTKQNQLKKQELIAQKQTKLNTLNSILDQAIKERNSARISYEIQSQNLARAKSAEEILIKNYETGTINFRDVLDVQELQLKFQMGKLEAIRNYHVQSTIIHYLSR